MKAILLPHQVPPPGDWGVWLLGGGRGAGKTWAGAHWVCDIVEQGRAKQALVVCPTISQCRDALRVIRALHSTSWEGRGWSLTAILAGQEIMAAPAYNLDRIRGQQFDAAWCEEPGHWARFDETWGVIDSALRPGARAMITGASVFSVAERVAYSRVADAGIVATRMRATNPHLLIGAAA